MGFGSPGLPGSGHRRFLRSGCAGPSPRPAAACHTILEPHARCFVGGLARKASHKRCSVPRTTLAVDVRRSRARAYRPSPVLTAHAPPARPTRGRPRTMAAIGIARLRSLAAPPPLLFSRRPFFCFAAEPRPPAPPRPSSFFLSLCCLHSLPAPPPSLFFFWIRSPIFLSSLSRPIPGWFLTTHTRRWGWVVKNRASPQGQVGRAASPDAASVLLSVGEYGAAPPVGEGQGGAATCSVLAAP